MSENKKGQAAETEQTEMRTERGRKRPFNRLFFQFPHNTLESPAGPIQAEVRGLLGRSGKVLNW